MQYFRNRIVYSATDLSSFVHCRHLVSLRRGQALGLIKQPYFDDPTTEALARRGIEHEKSLLEALVGQGRSVREIEWTSDLDAYAADTAAAMKDSVDVIYQGALFNGTWLGKPDFLIKTSDGYYEILDAKLAREPKGHALLQIILYAELLAEAQGRMPERVGLALAGSNAREEYFRVGDFAAFYRSVKKRFLDQVASSPELSVGPDPVEHCGICAWSARCESERRDVDHLSFVAGISRKQVGVLRDVGINTLASLANLDVPAARPADIAEATFERIQSQARLQLEGRINGKNLHELLQPIVEGQGLASLPEPDKGDVYFDLESDNNAFVHGIEYLFGYSDREGNYTAKWALTPEAEKAAFEAFVDFIVDRKRRYPGMHVYHYAPHETTALGQIMSRYGTRESEVDDLLRTETFVDLLRVVKQSLRASVESYSIKKLEPFCGYVRKVDLIDARKALAALELWLEFGEEIDESGVRSIVAGYNRDDCDAMLYLQNWLEQLRADLIARGTLVPRPVQGTRLRKEEERQEEEQIVALREKLLKGIPLEPAERSPDQEAYRLLGNLLGFHKREDKSYWWSFFDRLDMTDDECEEDREAIGNLTFVRWVPQPPTPTGRKRKDAARYKFPPQEHGFAVGKTAKRKSHGEEAETSSSVTVGTVAAINELECTIDLRLSNGEAHPTRIVLHDWINPRPLPDSLIATATRVAEHGLDDSAEIQLLLRCAPRVTSGNLKRESETVVAAGRRLVTELDRTVLPVQGPPGSGKTYLGARMILSAVAAGKKVGVTAQSHAVINNLLDEVFRASDEEGASIRVVQKPSQHGEKCDRSEAAAKPENVLAALHEGIRVAAGSAWLWASEDMRQSVDVMFVDEGGQFSLANAVAVAPAANSLVILGDPQQLDQPHKGVHPDGCGVSALDHLLAGEHTIKLDRGLFLDQTWRLHPTICRFTSEIFYNDRLYSRPGLERQQVVGSGSGLRLLLVPHASNTNNSVQEARAIGCLIEELLKSEWIDKDDVRAAMDWKDVVVVAPYNAQVDRIKKELGSLVRVGTVDKFQGQEAPVSIFSLAASSAEDAPRGMQFLYNPNRFNVATSRGRCQAIVVASPEIFSPECKTVDQMRWTNAFCRFAEEATIVPFDPAVPRIGGPMEQVRS